MLYHTIPPKQWPHLGHGLPALSITHYTLTRPGAADKKSEIREVPRFLAVTQLEQIWPLNYRPPATLKHLCPLASPRVAQLSLSKVVLLLPLHEALVKGGHALHVSAWGGDHWHLGGSD